VESGRRVSFVFYMGAGLPVYVSWIILSGLGAFFGRMIPDTQALGVDFLLPIYFLGLVMGFRKRPLWLPVVVASAIASIIAYKVVGSPWHVSIGAAAGVLLAVVLPPHRSGVGERP
jgi:predicted branched-subunit amino acid permease